MEAVSKLHLLKGDRSMDRMRQLYAFWDHESGIVEIILVRKWKIDMYEYFKYSAREYQPGQEQVWLTGRG